MVYKCPNNATCLDLAFCGDGWFDLSDTKDPGSPVLHFDTAELDAFAAAWLAGKFGNDPAALVEEITAPLKARIADLEAERVRLQSIHSHDFTNTYQQPITCICGVEYLEWLAARKERSQP